jgi:ribosomal protein S18 acetylase RimI-like enzyme
MVDIFHVGRTRPHTSVVEEGPWEPGSDRYASAEHHDDRGTGESVMSDTESVVVRHLTAADELELLRPLWLALHQHHREVQPSLPLQPDDDVSWRARSETYRRWLEHDAAVILVAETEGAVVGYAVAHLETGADDDTFAFGAQYAELYTMSVLPGSRGRRVGSHLLDAMDEGLRERSIEIVTVAAMAGNDRALDFYRRRGFEPLEMTFHRRVPDSDSQAGVTSRIE